VSQYTVPLLDLVLTMADTADLVSPAVADHHRRVACVVDHLARELELPGAERRDLVVAASLHDLGAFSLDERVATLEFEMRRPNQHAELGYLLFRGFTPFAAVAAIIRSHHLPWCGGSRREVPGQVVPLASQLLHLADRVDVLTLGVDDPAGTRWRGWRDSNARP
jgi:response regulator RpfG family c-di-GMP phosphodiesterase